MKKHLKAIMFCGCFPRMNLKMKLTTILLFVSLFKMHADTYAQSTLLTLNAEDLTVKQVFIQIESNSEFRFLFESDQIDLNRKVSIRVENKKIETVLALLFKGTNITYKINDRQIILTRQNVERGNKTEPVNHNTRSFIQAIQIQGNITDENGIPLLGVSVIEKNTSNGTQSDFDGNFSIEVSNNNSILIFSYIGFVTQEILVNSQTSINVVLKEDVAKLDEVVVVGYGSIKKSDITGSVSSIDNAVINRVGATSPMQALQANASGVNITQRTGSVGAGFDMQIRGANSLNGGSPLYVVDGVMIDNINFLNPNDIEQIDILKDASSTAIYGSRGSNGVVIVTTKSAEGIISKKPTISYSGYIGIRDIANMPDFLNSYDESVMWQQDREISRALYLGNPVTDSPYFGFPEVINENGQNYWEENLSNRNGTDWLDAFLKPSIQQNHYISASNSGEKGSYVIGFGYQGDDGNAKGQHFDKYNFKASLHGIFSEKFSMGANINLAYSDQELVSRQGYTQQLFRMPTYAPSRDLDGQLIQSPMIGISGNVSPFTFMDNNSYWNVQQYNVVSNFYIKYRPAEWITLSSTFSPNARFERRGEYKDRYATTSISVARMWNDISLNYVLDNQITLNKDFGAHSLSYDFIQSSQFNRFETSYAYGRDVPFKSLWYNTQSAPQRDASTGFEKSTLLSFTNRANYSYLDRYLLTATVRWDGSSKLADGNKWAIFPSAAIAWKMNEESFLQSVPQISNLKLRLSYGYTGNNNIAPYSTQTALNSQSYYDWDGQSADGFVPSALSNADLTWERTREWNFGVDFGFFNNRISGVIDLYDRLSLDLLMERKLAMPTGWGTMIDNVGSVSNKGIELQLKTVNINTGDFRWETNFIFSKNTNEIVELYGKKEDDVPNRWFIGQPVDVVYAMVFDGVWQRDELEANQLQTMEGTAKVKDLNNDGNIDIENDMKVLGSPLPNWIGTFSTNFVYKNWDLSATVYTKQGVLQYSPFHTEFTDFNSRVILDVPYYKRDNPITGSRYSNSYPQASYQGEYWGEDAEDYGFPGHNKDASFVRIQNITIGYNFGLKQLESLGLAGLRIYANALNPITFTDYEGFDPEWAGAGMSGIDAANTGYSIYQLGVNIKF